MIKYLCPICNKRACDSNKLISLTKLSANNENNADIVIKCQNCKNVIAVNITNQALLFNQSPTLQS